MAASGFATGYDGGSLARGLRRGKHGEVRPTPADTDIAFDGLQSATEIIPK